jgi:hypothetical protein
VSNTARGWIALGLYAAYIALLAQQAGYPVRAVGWLTTARAARATAAGAGRLALHAEARYWATIRP